MINDLSQNAYLTIYTDASVSPDTNKATFACAVYKDNCFAPDLSLIERISDHSGSMTAELQGIRYATLLVYHNRAHFNGRRFLIVTDSMSGLQALRNTEDPDNKACILGTHKVLETLANKYQIQGTIMWCPSHIGIPGNEKADELAGTAMNENRNILETPAANSVIKAKIKSAVVHAWKTKAEVSEYYDTVNPHRLPFRIPKAPRRTQSLLIKLRLNAQKYCAYRCQKLCNYCEDSFSTGHYFISCPVTRKPLEPLKSLLKEDEHGLDIDYQAANIISRLATTPHELLLKVLEKYPPLAYCQNHDNTAKFHHITFMPP